MQSISFTKFTLPNGLDVILHRDTALPIVSVNIWYHVGSKDEESGKTGFAHLFEHIMFEGSKHHNMSHFDPLQRIGATLNGSTNGDRTNYYENLPSNYLELALWLESDRMGFLLDALDQRRLDLQRDVVKNERRQSYENRPYGVAGLTLQSTLYPNPHPYHWPTIGFHEDLDSATLDDVKQFFTRFYSPSNASLAIAGDIDEDKTRLLVERYFADLPPGPALPRANRTDSPLSGKSEVTLFDNVLLPRAFFAWPSVPLLDDDEPPLTILATILGNGRSSRFYRKFVLESQIAQDIGVFQDSAEIAGSFEIDVLASDGHSVQEIQEALFDEISTLCAHEPSQVEVDRAKNRIEWRHVRQRMNIGGFSGKANLLNAYNVYANDPNLINHDLERYTNVSTGDILRVANKYLSDAQVQLSVLPRPSLKGSKSSLDRNVKPSNSVSPTFKPPIPTSHQLSNGLKIVVLEQAEASVIATSLIFNHGSDQDSSNLTGVASLVTDMLHEGTAKRTSHDIADEFEFIGSQLIGQTGREHTTLTFETLTRHWPRALEIFADVIQNSVFPEEELSRIIREEITNIRRLKDEPTALASQVTPLLIYGPQSPYGQPIHGTEDSLSAITRGDLVAHYGNHWQPSHATLAVVGGVSLRDVVAMAESLFGAWENTRLPDQVPKSLYPEKDQGPSILNLLDKPGAAQSVIRVGTIGIPRNHPAFLSHLLLNYIFGGQFTARLNMNLRQDKGFSYGYNSSIHWHRKSSLILAGGSVQTGVTSEALAETLKEFTELRHIRPVTEAEFVSGKSSLLQQLPSSFETPSQILGQIANMVCFDLPLNYLQTLPENLQAVSLAEVHQAAQDWLDPQSLVILVVGDKEVIVPELMLLGLEIQTIDENGREVDSK